MPAQAAVFTDERELLLAYIAQQRDGIRYAAYGLTEAQARLTPAASALSLGGLIKHVAAMERGWIDLVLPRQRQTSRHEAAAHDEEGFRLRPTETLADVLAAYATVARDTEAVVRAIPDLNQAVPVPKGVPWFPADVEAWTVCVGCCCTSLRRPPATLGTPTSSGSRSTGPRCMP
jgi:Protein of unknown function (DUF664)